MCVATNDTVRRRASRPHAKLSRFAPLLLPWLAACSARDDSPFPHIGQLDEPASVILITVDTLRRDQLGCYGYSRDTSPRIDALAAESLLFERALAPMATTLPSHLTLLTGLYPHQHGVLSNRRAAVQPFESQAGCRSVAELFAAEGYQTGGFVSALPLARNTGVSAGFDRYRVGLSVSAEKTEAKAIQWLEQRAQDGPFFLWVHYWDAHEPNEPLEPYATMFADGGSDDWIDRAGIDVEQLDRRFANSKKHWQNFFLQDLPESGLSIGREEIRGLVNRYDGDVRCIDDSVGRLIDTLRRLGLYERSILIFTADHGQSFGENDWFGHGTLSNVNTYVPLIVRLPEALAVTPRRLASTVSLADVFPSVVARLPLMEGAGFLAQAEGADLFSGDFTRPFALTQRSDSMKSKDDSVVYALLTDRWKWVQLEGGRTELYDLEGRGEGIDVRALNAEQASMFEAELRAVLARRIFTAESAERSGEDVDSMLKGLEELGYVGDSDD